MRALVLCLADPSGNPRPNRMIHFLKTAGCHVSVASLPPKKPILCDAFYEFTPPSMHPAARVWRKAEDVVALLVPGLSDMFRARRWRMAKVARALDGQVYDCLVVEDFHLLKFAWSLKGSAKVIFDAREYYPKEFENSFLWRLLEQPSRVRMCRDYLPRCDKVMTVSPGLAAAYRRNFGVDAALVRSMPAYQEPPEGDPGPRRDERKIRMVHHGIANRDRKLENMIALFRDLDQRFTLDFYLAGNPSYVSFLKEAARNIPAIRFHDPVPFAGIIPMLRRYDMGLYLLEPTGFNTEYSLPNKFFEYIQARLAVAIGPSPDMADLVRQYDCGIVSPDFTPQAMAQCLNRLTAADIARMKAASDIAARDLCFEKESEKLRAMFRELGLCA